MQVPIVKKISRIEQTAKIYQIIFNVKIFQSTVYVQMYTHNLQALPTSFLQVIKNWSQGRPGTRLAKVGVLWKGSGCDLPQEISNSLISTLVKSA